MNKKTKAEFGSAGDEPCNQFFLACEIKPYTKLFNIIDPFAYDIIPAKLSGYLGILNYDDPVYAITTTKGDLKDFIYGYVITITHPETIQLLDRLKWCFGESCYSVHERILQNALDRDNKEIKCWAYELTDKVLSKYESIEQIEDGIWDEDQTLLDFKKQDEEKNDNDEDDEEDDEKLI